MKKLKLILASALLITGVSAATAIITNAMDKQKNPFLSEYDTPYDIPPFDKITYADYLPALKAGIEQQKSAVEAIAGNTEAPTLENTIIALDHSSPILDKVCAVFFNLDESNSSPEMNAIGEEFYPLFMENNLEYTLEQNVYSLIMDVDGELIARAVSNLISNAVKYGKDGKAVHIELEKYDSELQIRVTNFGLIIPEDSVEHIFDRFYRVEGSRSSQTGGTGLGLNIAQEIAVLHGGKITVRSGINGTCFTIALPIDNYSGGNDVEKD